MKPALATLAAFAIAPLVPAIAFAVTSPGLGGGLEASIGALAGLALLGYWIALWIELLLAVPVFLVLHRYSKLSLLASAIAGGSIGVIGAIVFQLPLSPLSFDRLERLARSALLMCCIGAVAGMVFWGVRTSLLRVGRPS